MDKLKEVYEQFKITANFEKEIADVKIVELGYAVKVIYDNCMQQRVKAQ